MKFDIWKECPKVPLPSVLLTVVDNRGKTVPTAPSGHIASEMKIYTLYMKKLGISQRKHTERGLERTLNLEILFLCVKEHLEGCVWCPIQ